MKRRYLLVTSAWLVAAQGVRAQQREPLAITWLSLGPHPFIDDFRKGMRELGLIEGTHYRINALYPGGSDIEEVARLAGQALPTTQVFIASGASTAKAIQQVTDRVPIVGVVTEPVTLGLARSVARPEKNFTGIGIEALDTGPKSLELLKQAFPAIKRVLLLSEGTATGRRQFELIEKAATALQIDLVEARMLRPEDIDAAATPARDGRADAILVPASPFFSAHRDRLLRLAAGLRLPAMYEHRAFAEAGALICHGPDIAGAFHRLATYVERIRRGELPANMPIETVSRVELVVNRRTAREQHLVVSQEILARADEVIE